MRVLTPILAGAICALALVAAGFTADAAETAVTYYAAPNATNTKGCTKSEPCSLVGALASAKAASTVQLQPGTYPVSTPLSVSTAIAIHGATGPAMPEIIGLPSLTKDLLALSGGASISAVHLRSEAPGSDALDLNGASGDDLILEETASAPGKGGHAPAAGDFVASSSGTVLKDSIAWGSGTGTEGVIARGGKAKGESITLVNDTLIASGTGGHGLLSEQAAGTLTVLNTILEGTAGDIVATPVGVVRVEGSDFNPARSSGYTATADNLATAPVFVNAATGDFHELTGSPTIDAGLRSAALGATDPDGNPRTLGSAPDIGAYEYVPSGTVPPNGTTKGTTTPTAGSGIPGGGTSGPASPVMGRLVGLERISGSVLVRTPSSRNFTGLSGASTVPMGSLVDATRGVVRVTSALPGHGRRQALEAWGGVFQVSQSSRGSGMTRITLGGALRPCARHARAATSSANRRRPKMRTLWAKDNHGLYSTYGNNSVATVRGTEWETVDSCAGTLTRVIHGKVSVRDRRRHRTVLLRAGHSYLARR